MEDESAQKEVDSTEEKVSICLVSIVIHLHLTNMHCILCFIVRYINWGSVWIESTVGKQVSGQGRSLPIVG